jgi:hypothetical protein
MAERKGTGGRGSRASRGAARTEKDQVSGTLHFAGLEGERPDLRMEAVSPSGERTAIFLSDDGEFSLDPNLLRKGYSLDLVATVGEASHRYSYDTFFQQAAADPLVRLAESVWGKLHFLETCVSGSVTVCRPGWPWWDLVQAPEIQALSAVSKLSPLLPSRALRPTRLSTVSDVAEEIVAFPWFRCQPVCQGKVEVFIRTCCCPIIEPPVIIDDICKIIDCDLIEWPPPWWPGPPPEIIVTWPPDPVPWKGPIGPTGPEARAFKRSSAVEGAATPGQILQLRQHAATLKSLPTRAEQLAYIEATPILRYWGCSCSTTKVAEVPLQEDGEFSACFFDPFFLPLGCSRRVLYRVSQIQDGGWTVVYDGLAWNESFGLGDEPTLYAGWNAMGCDDPHDWGPVPFALLESIGNTWADTLIHSTQQNGETSFAAPLAAKDGLANEAPIGPLSPTAGPYDQPWAQTLALHYQFHPGLEGLGAKYFRTRVVPVNGNGQPTGSGFTVTGSLSWRKYYDSGGGGVGAQWVELSNPTVNGIDGLYTIPYPDLLYPWFDNQYHVWLDTAALEAGIPKIPNGRYLFVLDLFDAAGTRLIPNSAGPAGPGEATRAFEFRRLDGPIDAPFSNTSTVDFKALDSLFLVDNLSAYADIEEILHNGIASATNCQFLDGPDTDTVQLRYSAFQSNGYLWYHQIWIKQGLTGPLTYLPADDANVFSGDTAALSFADLLGSETKCAFSANLGAYVRHTNGFGRISGFDRYDIAAFALEITGP